jgi:hypothetical protein
MTEYFPHKLKLSHNQLLKLKRGDIVQVDKSGLSNGNVHVQLTKVQNRKLNTAKRNNRGLRIQLNHHQLDMLEEMHGGGLSMRALKTGMRVAAPIMGSMLPGGAAMTHVVERELEKHIKGKGLFKSMKKNLGIGKKDILKASRPIAKLASQMLADEIADQTGNQELADKVGRVAKKSALKAADSGSLKEGLKKGARMSSDIARDQAQQYVQDNLQNIENQRIRDMTERQLQKQMQKQQMHQNELDKQKQTKRNIQANNQYYDDASLANMFEGGGRRRRKKLIGGALYPN